jgi:O-acetylserine/cysteine efflux transporter
MRPVHILLGIFAMAVWGFNFVVIKVGLAEFPPLLLSALRFLFVAFPAVFLVRRPQVPWRILIGFGAMLGIVKFSLLFVGMNLGMSAGLASLVLQLQVFFTVFLAFALMGEALTVYRIAGMGIALAGIALIGTQTDASTNPAALVLVVGAAAAWSCANLIMKRAGSVNMFRFMVWSSLIPPLPLFVLSVLFDGWDTVIRSGIGVSWTGIGAVAYLAGLATLAGFAIWGRLLSLYPAALVAPFALLVPPIGMVSSALVLGEAFNGVKLFAAALVLAGLAVNLFGGRLVGAVAARAGRESVEGRTAPVRKRKPAA